MKSVWHDREIQTNHIILLSNVTYKKNQEALVEHTSLQIENIIRRNFSLFASNTHRHHFLIPSLCSIEILLVFI